MHGFQANAIPEGVAADGVDTLRKRDGNEVRPVSEEPVFNRPHRSEVLEFVEGSIRFGRSEYARKRGDCIGFGVREFSVGVGVENGDQLRLEVLVHEGDVPGRDFILEVQIGVRGGKDAEDAALDSQLFADGDDGGFGFSGESHSEAVVRGTRQHDDVIGFPRLEGSASGRIHLDDCGGFLYGTYVRKAVLVHGDFHFSGQGFTIGTGNTYRTDSFALDGEPHATAEVVEIQIQAIRLGHGDEQFVIEGTRHGCLGGG